jgi:hypothetical protein
MGRGVRAEPGEGDPMHSRLVYLLHVAYAVLLVLMPAVSQSAILYGLTDDGNSLFTVDTATGNVTTVGTLPAFGNSAGLDFDASGSLYAFVSSQDQPVTCGFVQCLYRVDPTDASTISLGGNDLGPFPGFEIIGDRAFASLDISSNPFGSDLYSISLLDGSPTLIGAFGGQTPVGLASDGVSLFGTSSQGLVEIDTGTGAILGLVGVHGVPDPTNVAYADGSFWIIPFYGDDLYSVDPLDGTATLVHTGSQPCGSSGAHGRPRALHRLAPRLGLGRDRSGAQAQGSLSAALMVC